MSRTIKDMRLGVREQRRGVVLGRQRARQCTYETSTFHEIGLKRRGRRVQEALRSDRTEKENAI